MFYLLLLVLVILVLQLKWNENEKFCIGNQLKSNKFNLLLFQSLSVFTVIRVQGLHFGTAIYTSFDSFYGNLIQYGENHFLIITAENQESLTNCSYTVLSIKIIGERRRLSVLWLCSLCHSAANHFLIMSVFWCTRKRTGTISFRNWLHTFSITPLLEEHTLPSMHCNV